MRKLELKHDHLSFPNHGAVSYDCAVKLVQYGIVDSSVASVEPLRTVSTGKYLVTLKESGAAVIIKENAGFSDCLKYQLSMFKELGYWSKKVAKQMLATDSSSFLIANNHIASCHSIVRGGPFPQTRRAVSKIVVELLQLNVLLQKLGEGSLCNLQFSSFFPVLEEALESYQKEFAVTDPAYQFVMQNFSQVCESVDKLQLRNTNQYYLFDPDNVLFIKDSIVAITDFEGIAVIPEMQSVAYSAFAFSESFHEYYRFCDIVLKNAPSINRSHLEVFPRLGLLNILFIMYHVIQSAFHKSCGSSNPYIISLAQDFVSLRSAEDRLQKLFRE